MGMDFQEKDNSVVRKITFFEVGLFVAGLSIMIVGFFVIHKQYVIDGYFSWDLVQSIFLWLILLLLVIIAAIIENVKEELSVVVKEHLAETKLMRQETVLLKECIKRKR